MFSRTNYTNPFQSFGFGASQQALGAGFGGINPMVPPQLMNPYANIPLAAFNGVGAGIGPWGAPINHALNPYLQHVPSHQLGLAAAQFGLPLNLVANPYAQQPYGYTAYGYPAIQQAFSGQAFSGQGFNGPGFNGLLPSLFTAPTLGVDPLIASAISQQSQVLPQSQLPIRPLFNPYQSDPFQFAAINQTAVPYQIGGLYGGPLGQSIDPSSILAQANLGQQALKQQIGSPWTANTGIPFWGTQPFLSTQGGYQACP